jgi:D-3-phosphoglycerate dehydrogenase
LAERAGCEVATPTTNGELEKLLPLATGLLIRTKTKVTEEFLATCPQLKFVITATSGFDHVDFEACAKRGIQTGYTPDANAASTAELTIAMILNLLRHIPAATDIVKKNGWRDQVKRGSQLAGLTLGIVGLGRVGKRVAALAKPFGLHVAACDPYIDIEEFKKAGVEYLALTELLRVADILTLHVPLTKETRRLINAHTIGEMSSDAYLINCARGELVSEPELAIALSEGDLRGAALDVFEKEPPTKDSQLRGRENLIMTPHIGAFTEQARLASSLQAADSAVHFMKQGKLLTPLPTNAAWCLAVRR